MFSLFWVALVGGLSQWLADVRPEAVMFGPLEGQDFNLTYVFHPSFGTYVDCTGARGFQLAPDLPVTFICLMSNATHFALDRWLIDTAGNVTHLNQYAPCININILPDVLPLANSTTEESHNYVTVGGGTQNYLGATGLAEVFTYNGCGYGESSLIPGSICSKNWTIGALNCMGGGTLQMIYNQAPSFTVLRNFSTGGNFSHVSANSRTMAFYNQTHAQTVKLPNFTNVRQVELSHPSHLVSITALENADFIAVYRTAVTIVTKCGETLLLNSSETPLIGVLPLAGSVLQVITGNYSVLSVPIVSNCGAANPMLALLALLAVVPCVAIIVGVVYCVWRGRRRAPRDIELGESEQPIRFDPESLDVAAKAPVPVRQWLRYSVNLINESQRPASLKFEAFDSEKLALKPAESVVVVNPRSYLQFSFELFLKYTTKATGRLEGTGPAPATLKISCAGALSIWLDPADFSFERQLGEGGFGIVWAGRWHGMAVAIKKSKIDFNAAGPGYLADWEKEVGIMERLRSPHVVSFLGVSLVPTCFAIVSELAPLGSLGSYVKQHRDNFALPLKKLMLADACRGLAFLHSNLVIHRDVKPDNVLVFSESTTAGVPRCKLTDFGTSRDIIEKDKQTLTKGVGTPVYLAPELLRGEKYGVSADVFSFGILTAAVGGEADPYEDRPDLKSQWSLCEAILKGLRPTFRDVDHGLEELAAACWQDDARLRPTAEQALAMLSVG
jgi:hypothetical protein